MAKKVADRVKSAGEGAHASAPSVPVQTRSERPTSIEPKDFPAVSQEEPHWKLSPVEKLRPMTEMSLDGSAYSIAAEERDGFQFRWSPVADAARGEAGLPDNRVAAHAWSETREVLEIEIHGSHDEPLYLARSALGSLPRAGHLSIRVANSARAIMVLESTGEASFFENVEFLIEEGADFQFIALQDWSADAVHVAAHFSKVQAKASFQHVSISIGGGVVIVNPSADLLGDGANANLLGAYFADQSQHLEHRVFVHHVAPNTISRVNYKGALSGAGARTVWIGDVLIGAEAVGTDSYEQNRNLVLTEGTRADSIPNLEIKTGDIEGAGHASATGRFDEEQLFYLESRGIGRDEARKLVVMGFLMEIVSKISLEKFVTKLRAQIEEKLISLEEN